MYLVTGGAGFIGSALVWALNKKGINNIVVVDRLGLSEKWMNLRGLGYSSYFEVEEFLDPLKQAQFGPIFTSLKGIFHMGACSSTTEQNATYLVENNYRISQVLAQYASSKKVPFIYASSAATYGDGDRGYSDNPKGISQLRPLNMYGYSKQMFDEWMVKQDFKMPWSGVKFFNVYGPNEYHKGEMRSLVHKAVPQILKKGVVKLFTSHKEGFKDGEQLRDFIYVKDVVEVCLYLLSLPHQGLINLGTGTARTFFDLAQSVFKAMGQIPEIEFIPMPENLREKYQYYTQAEMEKLRGLGYKAPFQTLEQGIFDYVQNYLCHPAGPYLGHSEGL